MDELLHHCLRELSFDGDFGCNISRLRDFIVEFYAHSSSPQNPDDAFCTFVWSLIVQQPTVRVGIVPPGVTSEVWIAPQSSARRKAKAKGEEHPEPTSIQLDIVHTARNRTLDDLKGEYGDDLRIAVDPDVIYAAITGSHIRFSKLSPMVYSALQIITRGRDNGVTVVQLGRQSGYDQKTCFYLVKQLTDLDLVVKVRRGGVGTHFVIHRHFFDRSPSWKAIRDEEVQAESSHNDAQNTMGGPPDEAERSLALPSLNFSPIDARHLSSLPLVRARVVKLLKASRNQMHASNNMLITIGFSNPTKTDRRFFQSRIREMIQQGIIEKVVVPSNNKKSINASVKCFRLASKDHKDEGDEAVVTLPQDGDDDDKDTGEQSAVKMNVTVHKQILDLLEESSTTGMTLNELSAALCHLDKRTIELLLARAEKYPPPSHLADLGIAGLMETSGRERRHRYFTVAFYRHLLAKENLDSGSSAFVEVDFSNVGGFMTMDSELFYEDRIVLKQYQDAHDVIEKPKVKQRTYKNPVLADGSIKQGRPRKYPIGEDPKSLRQLAKKRKREASLAQLNMSEGEHPNRPPKRQRLVPQQTPEGVGTTLEDSAKTPKKRGRPAKGKQKEHYSEQAPAPAKRRSLRSEITPERILKKPDDSGIHKERALPLEEIPLSTKRKTRTRTATTDKEASAIGAAREHTPAPSSKRPRVATKPPKTPVIQPFTSGAPVAGALHETTSERLINQSETVPSTGPSDRYTAQPTSLNGGFAQQAHLPQTIPAQIPHNQLASPISVSITQRIPVQSATSSRGILPSEFDSASRHSPSSGSHAVPIDPLLIMDVVDMTHNILYNASTPIANPSLLEPSATPHSPLQQGDPQNPSLALLKADAIERKFPQRSRANVSHMRRENELYRIVQNMGGIVNIQTKDFFEEHMSLLETMTKAGEATSAPVGTRTDKRTAVSTFNSLERQGRIKQLKTSVMTHTGVYRPACIVYLPTISQDALNAFLADLSRGVQPASQLQSFVKIDERIEYGADPASNPKGALPLQLLQLDQSGDHRKERWSKINSRTEQLLSYDDSVIRDVLLTERTTLTQLYGFTVGKAIRSREFHLSTLDAFERGDPSPNIISLEKRIVDLSFFSHDITLGLYCSLVSSLSYDDELTQFIGTQEGRQTLVHDLPPNISTSLQIGRSRARTRFLDLLETLRALQVVTPLQPSTSQTPWITCEASNGKPSAFDVASTEGWKINTPMVAPIYWHFNDTAPIHIWANSETSPPFWQNVSVTSKVDAARFWALLDEACKNPEIEASPHSANLTVLPTVTISLARSLRRRVSWNSEYIMTLHQMQYLKQFIDVTSGKTLLQEDDEGASQIEKISWVISAPQKAIRDFFQASRIKILKDLEKLKRKGTKQSSLKKAKRAAATKASLAKKAADARLQREEAWEAMLQQIHPASLDPAVAIRVRQIRTRFLQASSTKGLAKWEAETREAIREADAVAMAALKNPKKRAFAARAAPVPMETSPLTVAVNPPEKPVEALIAMQGPALVQEPGGVARKRKGKNGQDETAEVKPKALRRHRFQWSRDYDELARDASAIIRARCRNLSRLDWAAFEQVFPAVPRNTVRQRLAHLRETPGNEAYLNRLEDKWYEIWMQYRGTPALPDDDPTSSSHFNLINHVQFLRQHIDKNALRVGFAQPRQKAGATLPSTIDKLFDEYDVMESTPSAPSWDFIWNAVVEEGREKRMLRQPFLQTSENMPQSGEHPPEAVSLAESALKMTLGTPHERYDPELASALLHGTGEQYVPAAAENLLSRGVLSKLVRDPQKQKPGRQLKISEVNQNAIGGSIPRDTFQDAVALEDVSLQDSTWREWPLLATDGDSVALIQLVSENRLEFRIDTSHAQSCRPSLDWNSKKADDDQIETAVHVRTVVKLQSQPSIQTPEPSPIPTIVNLVEVNPTHGQSIEGENAACRRLNGSVGLADCMMCLEEEWVYFNDTLTAEDRELVQHVLTVVRQGAEHGVTKSYLRSSIDVAITSSELFSIVGKMVEWPVPMLFWAGYSSLVLVSSAYTKHWTVLSSENPVTRIFPRRWIDISGVKIVDFWEAALKAVMGVIVFRPGVSQAELRWRLRSVYDRQEVGDIVRSLLEVGHLRMRCDPMLEWDDNLNVATLDDREDKGVFWFVGDEKHWYQV